MGCCFSSPEPSGAAAEEQTTAPQPSKREAPTKNYSKPKWKHDQPLSEAKLQAMRDEFWDTQPHYGGDRVIWDAIKAACDSEDIATARLILDTAGVIVARSDMTIMYDELGARYVLPKYVLCAPTNLLRGEEQQLQLQPRNQA